MWAIGGGKGGIGKSFLAVNFATVAARTGRRVVLIDADLGGANLHTCLGLRGGERINLSDYLHDRIVDLEKAAIDTPVPGMRLILGTLGHTGAAETSAEQRERLVEAVRALPVDLVILDLAAGSERSTIDFFLQTDEGLLVTTPEPTAIENAYGFLKAAFYRRLGHAMSASPIRELIRAAMDQRNERGIRTPGHLLHEIEQLDASEGARFRKVIAEFRPRLVLNQVRNGEEVRIGFSIRSVCRKFFGIDLEYVGYVNYDDCVWRSVKERRPLVLAHPQSDGALYIRRIAKKMLEP
ncbi:MAG: P-loop NTPase [Myxococcota bacterium]